MILLRLVNSFSFFRLADWEGRERKEKHQDRSLSMSLQVYILECISCTCSVFLGAISLQIVSLLTHSSVETPRFIGNT